MNTCTLINLLIQKYLLNTYNTAWPDDSTSYTVYINII